MELVQQNWEDLKDYRPFKYECFIVFLYIGWM